MPILGDVWNIVPMPLVPGVPVMPEHMCTRMMGSWKYQSPILSPDRKGHFTSIDMRPLPITVGQYKLDQPTYMQADRMHSVFVPKGQTAAWFIWEGEENAKHNPICYSDTDLTDFDFSQLDLPMTADRLREDLEIIGVKG
jgi:hypothetical protein